MTDHTTTTTAFDHLTAGPPFAANGGLVVGRLAERFGRWSGVARLSAPVPLDTDVAIAVTSDEATLAVEGRPAASLVAGSPVPANHPVVDWDTAVAATAAVDLFDHPFPACVVCGPEAPRGMGLFPGRVDGGVAAPWTPTAWQAGPSGAVSTQWVTAALDCPSGIAAMAPGEAILLGSMAFTVRRRPVVGERLVVTGTEVSRSGRKRNAASAIRDASGAVIAAARTVWIAVDAVAVARRVAA